MGRFNCAEEFFSRREINYKEAFPCVTIGEFDFRFELDTGGGEGADLNVWIEKQGIGVARRTWEGVLLDGSPDKKHVQRFCEKFARDESYRQKYLF